MTETNKIWVVSGVDDNIKDKAKAKAKKNKIKIGKYLTNLIVNDDIECQSSNESDKNYENIIKKTDQISLEVRELHSTLNYFMDNKLLINDGSIKHKKKNILEKFFNM